MALPAIVGPIVCKPRSAGCEPPTTEGTAETYVKPRVFDDSHALMLISEGRRVRGSFCLTRKLILIDFDGFRGCRLNLDPFRGCRLNLDSYSGAQGGTFPEGSVPRRFCRKGSSLGWTIVGVVVRLAQALLSKNGSLRVPLRSTNRETCLCPPRGPLPSRM